MSNELTLIIAIVGFCSSLIAIISFVLTRKEKGENKGEEHGEMVQDIKYIKQTQTDILVGQRELTNKLDGTKERVTRIEEQVKMHEKRIQKLEK